MKQYLCHLGHVSWRLWPGRCPECGAYSEWTGLRRGFLLEDHVAWKVVWGQVRPDPQDAQGCWLWIGAMRSGAPFFRLLSVRKEMWEFWTGEALNNGRLPVACGEARCVRPTHTARWAGIVARRTAGR